MPERRVRLDPARPSPAPTSFDDPISGLRVATSLAPRQLGRHQTFFVLRTVAKGLLVEEGCGCGVRCSLGRGMLGVALPQGAQGEVEGGPDTSPTQGAHTSS